MSSNIISATELHAIISDNDISILDATLALSQRQNIAHDNFLISHIDNAQFFDIDVIADDKSTFAHTLPSPEIFSSMVSKLGVSHTDHIIVYDQYGMFSAARAWWMFKIMGAKNVRVLDGGLPEWKRSGYTTYSGAVIPSKKQFNAQFNPNMVKLTQDVYTAMQNEQYIIDARSEERFSGKTGFAKDGHIPNSINLHYKELLDERQCFLPKEQLKEKIQDAGFDYTNHIITTCGSGVTACILALALDETAHKNYSVYDGSWIEWSNNTALPICKHPY